MWCELLEVTVVAVVIIQLVRLLLADADLTLLFKEKFGKSPATLKGQVVWITGASSGIGEYLAYDLAKAGCKLILSARREDELKRVMQQCLSCGSKEEDVFVLPLDLLKFDTHADAVQSVLQKFSQIDILVNNSGRSQRAWAAKTDMQVDRDIMEINYFGTLSLTKLVLPHMQERKQGHIVVTSSVAGKLGAPFSASYSATKFALQGWFDTLRLETHSDNIAVTMVCPGPVTSNITQAAFTEKDGTSWGKPEADPTAKKMSTERCSELMLTAIVNKLDEVWISDHPVLLVTYLAQYFPGLARFVGKTIGMKMVMKLRYAAGNNK